MFQSFDVSAEPEMAKQRVKDLRERMEILNIDGFIVPRADEHQGEYVPPHAQRLKWLTGFTGSAGVALILKNSAIIFVDGRYTLQVRQQTDSSIFNYEDLVSCPPSKWLAQHAAGLRIGFDPWLHTMAGVEALRSSVEEQAKGELVALSENLVDMVWTDQPEPPLSEVTIQPIEYAGVSAEDKIRKMQDELQKTACNLTVLTDPSSIAWTFNIRGKDVSNTPFALSFAIIRAEERPSLFIDERKLGHVEKKYLEQLCDQHPPAALLPEIRKEANANKSFALDPQLVADILRHEIITAGGKVVEKPDPARLPRAVKNAAELEGARRAHARDGVALCRFFAWLSRQTPGNVSEISAAQQLEELRASTAIEFGSKLEDLSFDTISGAGPDGAIIHYRVTKATDRQLNDGELYLVDSGAQYRDGTTDVTRTVAIGKTSAEEKRCFTLVLKGMIAMSAARFPAGTRGQDIDVLARIDLWKAGLDYAHGTGHGVGAYLSVHEGPQNLSKRGVQELLPGMIISNEPGYYREGAFGIRIENLLAVEPAENIANGDHPMLGFETLTYCPIDRSLIDVEILTIEERNWLNRYHAEVFDRHSCHLDDADRAWLEQATKQL
ncbi:aminopeptidase P family protein [Bartonella sp. LJL80]